MEEREAHALAERVEGLLGELDGLADPAARERALGTVQALLELYGEGLRRIVAAADAEGLARLAGDDLVSHLLLVHDLHPRPLEERVGEALASVRPYLESHGGGVEVLGVEGGVVRLSLQGSCNGCPSSTMTLKLAIEDAIRKAAPDVEAIEADGAAAPDPAPQLIQLEVSGALAGAPPAAPADTAWETVGSLPQLAGGGTLVKPVAGERLLFARVEDDVYAYRPECPGCGGSLEAAELRGAELRCPGCANHYDLRRAGRCLDAPRLHLEPVPLLVGDSGIARVAVGGVAA